MSERRRTVRAIVVLAALLALWRASGLGMRAPEADLSPAREVERPVAAVAATGARDPDGSRSAASSDPASSPSPPVAAAVVPTAGLRVIVLDEHRRPVPACLVTADGITATSDAAGGAEFVLDAGRRHISVDPPTGRQFRPRSGWQTLRAGTVVQVEVVLDRRLHTLQWCRLVADEDGRTLVGVPVRVQPAGSVQHSGEDGLVNLAFGPDDTHADAKAPGRSLRQIAVEPGHDAPATAMTVPLALGASLRVSLADAATAPVSSATATLSGRATDLQWPPLAHPRGPALVWTAVTDARGVADFVDLPVGVGLLATFVDDATPGAPEPTTWVLLGRREERRVEWPAMGEVRGVVRAVDGAPVPDVGVRAVRTQAAAAPRGLGSTSDHRGAATDAEGRFRIAGLGPGAWLVGPASGAPFAPSCVRIELAAGGSADVVLRVAPGLEVAGRAIAPDGSPAAGVTVRVQVDGAILARAQADGDGRFHAPSLPEGPCELWVEPFAGDLGLGAPLVVQAGAKDVELRLSVVRGSISGRCSGGGGDVWIMAWRRGSHDALGRSGELDGSFCYRGMRAGTWDVRASDRRGRSAVAWDVQVLPGRETSLQLDLAPGATLRPLHASADEFVVQRGEQVAARDNLEAGIGGEAVVPAGAWTVRFLAAGREVARREVSVSAGATVVVDGGR